MAATVQFVDPVINVKNVARSADWYRRILGLKVEVAMPDRKKPSFVRMTTGDPRGVAIMLGDGSDPMSGKKAPEAMADAIASKKAQRVVSLYFRVDKDIDALYRSARRKGAKVISPPTDMPYGMREFHLRDPDGYDVAVGEETG